MTVFCEYNFHIKHNLHIYHNHSNSSVIKPLTLILTLEIEETTNINKRLSNEIASD